MDFKSKSFLQKSNANQIKLVHSIKGTEWEMKNEEFQEVGNMLGYMQFQRA